MAGVADDICRLCSVIARQHSRCRESIRLFVSVQHPSFSALCPTNDDCQHCSGRLITHHLSGPGRVVGLLCLFVPTVTIKLLTLRAIDICNLGTTD